MSDSFNGYHVWLGIPPSEQPPNHYRLLGIAIFETDLDVIDHAADRQMAHVRTFQSGRNGGLSQRILNELAAARVCLLNPPRKVEYDDGLRAKLSSISQAVAVPVGVAVPMAQPAMATPVFAQPTTAAQPIAGQPGAAAKSGISAKPAAPGETRTPDKAGGRGKGTPASSNPSRSGTYAMPPSSQSATARAAQPSPGNANGSSDNLTAAVAPIGVAPVKTAGATPPPRPATTAKADDDDPYGLSISSRRPLASRNVSEEDDDDDVDDDAAIRHKVGGVDLSLRSRSRDALIQKLAIYGFVCVAVIVVIMVTKNVIESNYGPIRELFKQPAVELPVAAEPKPIHAPAAPLPAPAAGQIAEDAGDPNAGDPPSGDSKAGDGASGESNGNVVGDGKGTIPAVQSPSDLESPADLEAPSDLSEPQLEIAPLAPPKK